MDGEIDGGRPAPDQLRGEEADGERHDEREPQKAGVHQREQERALAGLLIQHGRPGG